MNGEKTSKPSGKGISNPAVQKQSEAEDVRLLRNKQHLSWSLSKVDQAVWWRWAGRTCPSRQRDQRSSARRDWPNIGSLQARDTQTADREGTAKKNYAVQTTDTGEQEHRDTFSQRVLSEKPKFIQKRKEYKKGYGAVSSPSCVADPNSARRSTAGQHKTFPCLPGICLLLEIETLKKYLWCPLLKIKT